jgi:hypothetical protein
LELEEMNMVVTVTKEKAYSVAGIYDLLSLLPEIQ